MTLLGTLDNSVLTVKGLPWAQLDQPLPPSVWLTSRGLITFVSPSAVAVGYTLVCSDSARLLPQVCETASLRLSLWLASCASVSLPTKYTSPGPGSL